MFLNLNQAKWRAIFVHLLVTISILLAGVWGFYYHTFDYSARAVRGACAAMTPGDDWQTTEKHLRQAGFGVRFMQSRPEGIWLVTNSPEVHGGPSCDVRNDPQGKIQAVQYVFRF